jgi:hypothetical protein
MANIQLQTPSVTLGDGWIRSTFNRYSMGTRGIKTPYIEIWLDNRTVMLSVDLYNVVLPKRKGRAKK